MPITGNVERHRNQCRIGGACVLREQFDDRSRCQSILGAGADDARSPARGERDDFRARVCDRARGSSAPLGDGRRGVAVDEQKPHSKSPGVGRARTGDAPSEPRVR
jgi:hypothetical protein